MRIACVALSAVLSSSGVAIAQNTATQSYPTKPIRFVIPFPPGGPADIFGRTIGQQLSDRWNQQVVIDNRPGAGQTVGTEIAARAAPDGHTILIAASAHTINPSLWKLRYDSNKDFSAIGMVAMVPAMTTPAARQSSMRRASASSSTSARCARCGGGNGPNGAVTFERVDDGTTRIDVAAVVLVTAAAAGASLFASQGAPG